MTTQKQITDAVTSALKPLVGGRVKTRQFPQTNGAPVWPAIRFTFISAGITEDACGDGGEETADYRFQLDVVDLAARGESQFLTLCAAVQAAVSALGPQYRWAGMLDGTDEDLKVFTRSIDFIVYLSS